MARDLSDTFRQEIFAAKTDALIYFLLEIAHEDLDAEAWPDGVIRVTNAGEDVTYNGDTFYFYGFLVDLPSQDDGNVIVASRITIDNVDQWLTEVVRGLSSWPTVKIMVVHDGEPDVAQAEARAAYLVDVTITADQISGTLSYEPILNEPYPGHSFTPTFAPGGW